MRVLITGSSGQIGTNLALRLLRDGHFVFGVDKRPNTWTAEIEMILQDLSIPYDDFETGIGQAEYPDGIDIVVHLAANAKVHELVQHPTRALQNVNMTFNVLEYCRRHGIPLIFSSSREVYGDVFRYITEESHTDINFTESPYSASKMSGESFIYSYARCYGMRYLVFRFSNVYGRYDCDLDRMERVIPLFIRDIRAGEPITIFGEKKVLDFTYVDDCVDGIVRGIEYLVQRDGESHTINLAYGQGQSLVDMARYVGECLNVEPAITIESSRVGEVTHYIANIGKARALLGYNPATPLKDGIAKAVRWMHQWEAAREKAPVRSTRQVS